MTDLGDFLAALHGPAATTARPTPLDEIVRKGRRLRIRRRVAGGLAWLGALSVLTGGSLALWEKTSYSGPPPVRTAGGNLPTGVRGDVVETGLVQPGGRIVLMMSHTRTSGMASIGCFATDDGTVSGCRNVWDLPDRSYATGFHALHAPVTVAGKGRLPIFGYFVGPVKTITAKAGGRTVTAQVATWSEDRDVKLFWLPFDQVSPGEKLTGWAAYQADGRPVPTGHARLDPPHA